MRMALLALALAAMSGAAWACPMHNQQTAGNDQQVVASSGNQQQAPSTPIPRKQSQDDGKS
jgi:hypothetical protein